MRQVSGPLDGSRASCIHALAYLIDLLVNLVVYRTVLPGMYSSSSVPYSCVYMYCTVVHHSTQCTTCSTVISTTGRYFIKMEELAKIKNISY